MNQQSQNPMPASSPCEPALFELRGVCKRYPGVAGDVTTVFKSLNLVMPNLPVVGLIGPSGHGKSTLLHLLGGLDVPDSGEVISLGRQLPRSEAQLRKYRQHHCTFIWQNLNLIGHLTALENASMPLLCRGYSRAEAQQRGQHWLEQLHIDNWSHRRPSRLSSGQKQRVAIARAMASDAALIFADEPTAALDPPCAMDTMKILRHLICQHHRRMIVVSHDVNLMLQFCDLILRVNEGRVEPLSQELVGAAGPAPAGVHSSTGQEKLHGS